MKFIKKAAAFLLFGTITLGSLRQSVPELFTYVENIINRFTEVSEADELSPDTLAPKRGNHSPKTERDVSTSTGASNGWYCKHTQNGERPSIPSEMSYLTKHNGYFLGEDEKVIYLTFDAGYENGNIEKILDTLKKDEVPGAFFVLENLVKTNTDLIERMIKEGHTVCNHTARHKDMTKMTSKEAFATELEEMETIYSDITGKELSKYYRPPEGKISEENLMWADELGYKTIMWSYAYADWDNNNQMSPDKAIEKVMSGIHNGEVLLLHPTSSTNAEILPELIKRLKDMGYRFGTLDELTGAGDNG